MAGRFHPVLAFVIAGAIVAGLAVVPVAAAPAARPGILVEPFDLFDTSIDHRPQMIAAQKRWLDDAGAALRARIDAGGASHVIDTAASRKLTKAIAADYQHPSTCRPCAISDAKMLGAGYVFIGALHKVSDLIIYMDGELVSVRTGKAVVAETYEVKADDRRMLLRAASRMARTINRAVQ